MLTSKMKETIENLFQFDLDRPYNYLWCCYEKDTIAPIVHLLKGQGARPPLSGIPAYCYQQSLSELHNLPRCLRHTLFYKNL